MAGEGRRFTERGYTIHKPAIPTFSRIAGKTLPMAVCAALELPFVEKDGSNVLFIARTGCADNGVIAQITRSLPKAQFLLIDKLTDGQACTCLLAESCIDLSMPLLIAGCDNGMVFSQSALLSRIRSCDCLAFTYRGDERTLATPEAYGWLGSDEIGRITKVAVKTLASEEPQKDHVITATFWFREGRIFTEAARDMVRVNDRVNGEFYVDTVMKYIIAKGYDARVFDIDRYLGWGTPDDYELYQRTVGYWKDFMEDDLFRKTYKRVEEDITDTSLRDREEPDTSLDIEVVGNRVAEKNMRILRNA